MTRAEEMYNTTVAYRSEDLSTAAPCFNGQGHGSNFQPINYTMLQYPPPNPYFSGCDTGMNTSDPNLTIGASIMFSYPPDLTQLVASWSTCTLPHVIQVMDPPHILEPATAMVPAVSSSPTAAPAAHITLPNVPPTSLSNGSPSNTGQPRNEGPSSDDLSGSFPSSAKPHDIPQNSNDDSSKPDISSNSPPTNDDRPNKDPSINSFSSIVASGSPQSDAPSQGNPIQDPKNAQSMQSQSLGALIANAFGHGPDATPPPLDDPDVPDSSPIAVQILVNGTPSPVIVAGVPISVATNGAELVAAQTIDLGDQATLSGAVVSVGNGTVVIDGVQLTFSQTVAAAPTPLIVGGYTAQRAPNGGLIIASQTIAPSAQAIVDGVLVSVDSSNVILDRITHHLTTMTSSMDTGQPLVFEASGHKLPYVIARQGLTPGDAATTVFSSVPISLPAPEASGIQAGRLKPLTIGTQVFTPNPSAFAIGDTTLSAGGPGFTIAGMAISQQRLGGGLVIGSSTLALAASATSPGSPTRLTIGNDVFIPNPSGLSIDGAEILAGGRGVIVAGTLISLEPSGRGLVMGSSTLALSAVLISQSPAPSLLTIDGQVVTPNPTGFSIAGTTISAGGPGIMVHETMLSLKPLSSGAGGLVIDSSTVWLVAPSANTRNTISVTLTSSGGGPNEGTRLASFNNRAISRHGTGGLVCTYTISFLISLFLNSM